MAESSNISPGSATECGCVTQDPSTEVRESRAESQDPRSPAAGEQVKQAVQKTTASAQASAQELAERAKQQISEAAQKAGAKGRDFIKEQQGRIARELHAYADAARRAAGRLEDEKDTNLAHYLRSAAGRIDSFGSHLQDRTLGDLVDEAENMVRRRPEIFFGAMFVAGLAAARFVKASKRKRMHDLTERESHPDPESEAAYFQTQPVSGPVPELRPPAPTRTETTFPGPQTGQPL